MASKKAKLDLLGQISRKYTGSGDPEISDAKDVTTYLSEKYTCAELTAALQALHARVLAVSGMSHADAKSTVPDKPVGDGEEFWVMIWNLGYQEDSAYRGKPQTVHVLEIASSFLEKKFDSMNFPPKLALPPGATPGGDVTNMQYKHVLGFTRVLAAFVILEGVHLLNLSDSQLLTLSDVLLSCFCIRANYKAYESEDKAREESLRLKFQVADSVRPSVFQIYYNLRKRVERQGLDFVVVCKDAIKSFNSETDIEGYRISDLEQRVVSMLPHQTEAFFQALEYHWQNYKTGESGVPLVYFDPELGVFEKVESDKIGVWAQIYDLNSFKNEVALLYMIGTFLKSIKEVLRKKQKPNLRNNAQRYRTKDPQLAMKIACLWAHFRPSFIKKMSAEDFKDAEAMFFRGSFDREFTDKVNAENEALKVDDFRFIHMFKSVASSSVHAPLSTVLDEDGNQAQEEADEAQLKVLRGQLQKDVEHWENHVKRVQEHEDSQRHSKRVHARTQDKKVREAVEKRQETHFPVRAFKADEGLATWIPTCIQSWSDDTLVQLTDTYLVFFLDLTKAGNAFRKVLPLMLRIIGDIAAQKPRQVCGIVIAPLVGARGNGTDADAADEAHDDCETQMKADIFRLSARRLTFSFEASASHTGTWCSQQGWMLFSNMMDMNAAPPRPLCDFAASHMCTQRGVVDLTRLQEKDFVLPTSSVTVAPGNLSQAQRRLQKFSGAPLFGKLRKALWSGMKLNPRHGAAWIDIMGYDASLATSVIADNARPSVQQPSEMVLTAVPMLSDDDNDETRKRVAKWIRAKHEREIRALIIAKSIQVPDLVVSEWRSTVQCPVIDVTLLKVTMPTADKCLAIKQSAVDDWEKKLVVKHTALRDIIQAHDAKYNPSGRTHKTTADTSASSSAGGAKSSVPSPSDDEPIDWPAEQTYDSMDAIKSEGKLVAMVGSPPEYTMHASGNKIFVQAHEDCVLHVSKPLFHVWGKYHTGSEVAAATKKKASLMPLEVTSLDFVAYWSGLSTWPEFTTCPCPLSDFITYLEENGATQFEFACHEVTFGTEEDMEAPMTIKSKEKCAFEPFPYPTADKNTPQMVNFGSKIPKTKVDWSTGEVAGGLCFVKFNLKYDDSMQMKGISPARPAVFVKKSMRMKKGQVYALVW